MFDCLADSTLSIGLSCVSGIKPAK